MKELKKHFIEIFMVTVLIITFSIGTFVVYSEHKQEVKRKAFVDKLMLERV